MINRSRLDKPYNHSSLNPHEEHTIEQRVKLELDNALCKMIRISLFINAFIGFFVAWTVRSQVQTSILVKWYLALICVQLINVIWSYYYERHKANPSKVKIWRIGYLCILAVLSLIWGSIGVLFTSDDIRFQIYIITCLQIALIAFNVGAMIDFLTTVINTVCLLLPFVSLNLYTAYHLTGAKGPDLQLAIAFTVTLTVLGLFLLITTYVGSRVIKRFFTLIFENVALSQKLEQMNKFLEQRVKERTVELEDSLKLVRYQSTHDLLTDLPNQRLLYDNLTKAILNSSNNNHKFVVIFIALNEIKKINDAFGYQTGEIIIKTIAQRFKNMFATSTHDGVHYYVTLSRKDIFVIIADPVHDSDKLEAIGAKLFSLFDKPVYNEKRPLKLTASIGMSIYPNDGMDGKKLLMHADIAMRHAKRQGGNHLKIYKSELDIDATKQLEIEANLHTALENHEFLLHYQPIINLKTHQICGAEALVRWNNPVLGFISPADFIHLAEANGIIIPLGNWIAHTACVQTKAWHDMGFTNLRISVNISAKQLQNEFIIQTFEKILTETQLDPKYIELELTETLALQETVVPILKRLKTMGFCLSIDDFGTGYSGLSNLKLFSIDTLKIDKSFIDDVDKNPDNSTIVSNTITLAREMDFHVIAEGVETKEQVKYLLDHDCDMIQGYYFSRPLHVDAFTALLASNKIFDF